MVAWELDNPFVVHNSFQSVDNLASAVAHTIYHSGPTIYVSSPTMQ
jgi:hypothetical protein